MRSLRTKVRLSIPLIGCNGIKPKSPLAHALRGTLDAGDLRRLHMDWERRTRPATILKPERVLGAPWIDSFVALRKSVTLCEDCYRRYDRWWQRYDYRAIWFPKEITDCDGCSKSLVFCTGFYPSESGRKSAM